MLGWAGTDFLSNSARRLCSAQLSVWPCHHAYHHLQARYAKTVIAAVCLAHHSNMLRCRRQSYKHCSARLASGRCDPCCILSIAQHVDRCSTAASQATASATYTRYLAKQLLQVWQGICHQSDTVCRSLLPPPCMPSQAGWGPPADGHQSIAGLQPRNVSTLSDSYCSIMTPVGAIL
jgi:hypothetical protein